jgi:hypothetical protein
MAYGTLNAGTITPGSGNTLAISEAVTVPTPTATTHAATKAYVDSAGTNSSITTLGTVTTGTLNGVNLTSLKSSNGSVTAMTCDSTGRIFTPARPAFAVKSAATQTDISSGGSGTYVVFGTEATEVFDIGNNFTSSTFTAPVAGIYNFSTSIRMNQIPTNCNYVDLHIVFTGGPPITQNFMSEPTQIGLYDSISVSQLVNMDVGDTAKVRVYYDAGSGLDIASGDGTRFSGYLVG